MKAKVILATILILAASCVKNEVREVSIHGDGQILYNPAPLRSMTTKADVQTTKFPTSSTFGSCAWYLPGDNKWDDHHAAVETATVVPSLYIEPSEISYKDSQWKAWKSEKSYYWPMNGSLTFISWAPADLLDKVDASNNKLNSVTREEGFKITGWTMRPEPGYGIVTSEGGVATTDPNLDILLSYTKDCTRNTASGKVLTKFSHLLCKVKVEARLANENVETKVIESVTLTNIYTKSDYVAGKWTNQSACQNYVYTRTGGTSMPAKDPTKKVIFPETMFLPQYLSKDAIRADRPKISIKLQGSETPIEGYLWNDKLLNSLSVWDQGKSITYAITIGDEIVDIDFSASAGGWEYDSSNSVTVQ